MRAIDPQETSLHCSKLNPRALFQHLIGARAAWPKAGPYGVPGLSPLDELDRETVLAKRRGRGQACQTSADDQDRVDLGRRNSDLDRSELMR
jgi:hypothetical protein